MLKTEDGVRRDIRSTEFQRYDTPSSPWVHLSGVPLRDLRVLVSEVDGVLGRGSTRPWEKGSTGFGGGGRRGLLERGFDEVQIGGYQTSESVWVSPERI